MESSNTGVVGVAMPIRAHLVQDTNRVPGGEPDRGVCRAQGVLSRQCLGIMDSSKEGRHQKVDFSSAMGFEQDVAVLEEE